MNRPLFFHSNAEQLNSAIAHGKVLLEQLEYLSSLSIPLGNSYLILEWHQKIATSLKENILYRDNLIDNLQKQIDLLCASQLSAGPLDDLLLPGKIFQNDTRVNWESLRKKYNVVIDQPVYIYQQQIESLLETSMFPDTRETITFGEALSIPEEQIVIGKSGKLSLAVIDLELNKKGLCRGITPAFLMNRFYWSHFCQVPLYEVAMSTKTHNCLRQFGLRTIGNVIIQPQQTLATIRLFGIKGMQEIVCILNAFGFKLGMTNDDIGKLYGL